MFGLLPCTSVPKIEINKLLPVLIWIYKFNYFLPIIANNNWSSMFCSESIVKILWMLHFFFFFAITLMWQIMSGKDKTLDSYERDRQLLLICHVKVMAKKKKKKKKIIVLQPLKRKNNIFYIWLYNKIYH